ncbi:MAG: oligosaccharide repeat unit polymerase [Gammaproteobacteria bacterium]|nr:oligosaccharide repeat unit polymerase [Gammaproteobacteria bacterium]
MYDSENLLSYYSYGAFESSVIVFLLIGISLLFVSVSRVYFARWVNPVSLVICWWIFWLCVSMTNEIGVYKPSLATILLVVSFIFFILLGSIFYLIQHPINNRANFELVTAANSIMFQNRKLVLGVILILSSPVIYGFLNNVSEMLDPIAYVNKVRGENGLYRSAFGSKTLGYFVTGFSMLAMFAGVYIGLVIYQKHKRIVIFAVSAVLLVLYSLVTQERLGIVLILYALFIRVMVSNMLAGEKIFTKRVVGGISFFLVIAVLLTGIRNGELSLFEIINNYALMYHVIGFSVFDHFLWHNSSTIFASPELGRVSLGFFDRLLFIVSKLSGLEFYSSRGLEMNILTASYIVVGHSANGQPIEVNALSTILMPLYLDGGLLFLVIFGFVIGFYVAKFYVKAKSGRSEQRMGYECLLMVFLYALIGSIYQGVFSNQFFWGSVLFIYVFSQVKLGFRLTENDKKLCVKPVEKGS